MKTKVTGLTLDQAAQRLAELTDEYLDRLPVAERQRRRKAFNALAREAAARLKSGSAGTPAKSGRTSRSPMSPVAARGHR